jgi:hypothetical protein
MVRSLLPVDAAGFDGTSPFMVTSTHCGLVVALRWLRRPFPALALQLPRELINAPSDGFAALAVTPPSGRDKAITPID